MNIRKLLAAASLVAALGACGGAAAARGLSGDTIEAGYNYPALGVGCCSDISYSNPTFVVTTGVETTMTASSNPFTFDFESDSLTIGESTFTFNGGSSFNGPIFTDTSGADFGQIKSVSGIDPSLVTISGNALQINWGGVPLQAGQQIVVQFGSAVPEPASWLLMIVGFGGIGLMFRRTKNTTGGRSVDAGVI